VESSAVALNECWSSLIDVNDFGPIWTPIFTSYSEEMWQGARHQSAYSQTMAILVAHFKGQWDTRVVPVEADEN